MVPNPAFRRLSLYTTAKSYTFVPEDQTGGRSLTLHRDTGEITTSPINSSFPTSYSNSTIVYGIIGLITLSISDYVVVMTGRELRAQFMGHDVFLATQFDILPISPDVSISHHPVESYLLGLLRSHLSKGLFWFSYEWDLTRRLQAQWAQKDEGKALWEVADDRFFWNKFLQSRFIDIATAKPELILSPYILPIMFGTFDIRSSVINEHKLQLCLISRRSRYRAGTRYFRRGVDKEGKVANFNETEQILLVNHKTEKGEYQSRLSFVQIRGSVPLYWAEINTLCYKPDLQIMDLEDSDEVMRRHLLEQVNIYGEQNLVNMVNHKGHERPIKEAFERRIQQLKLPRVKYEYFDFHTECKHMRWERIGELIDRIEADLLRQGYFHQRGDRPETPRLQMGTIRTNCMDNLDRTNVAQAAFAKWTLNRQLRELGVFGPDERIDDHEKLLYDFRHMWADHADLISTAYSGTGALKTDYTRTGKRSKWGLLEDGTNSVMRYLKNNYFDGPRQDAFDLFTGSWTPRPGTALATALFSDERALIVRSMPHVAWFSVFMILAGLTLPRSSDYSLSYWFILWFTILTIALAFIFANGMDYVAWPRLNPPTGILFYEGPGYNSRAKTGGYVKSSWKGKGVKPRLLNGVKWAGTDLKSSSSTNGVEEIELGTRKRTD